MVEQDNNFCEDLCCEPIAKTESDRIKSTSIKQVDNGYIITVGCKTFVIESLDKLIKLLTVYLTNPDTTEDMWYKNKDLNKLIEN